MSGISALIKGTPESSLIPSPMGGPSRKLAIYKLEDQHSALGLPAPGTVRKKIL